MTAPDRDPFAGSESAPSISFKDVPVGTVRTLIVDGPAKSLQQRIFGTDGELAFWPGKNGQPGNPKMAAVLSGADPDGEACSLWAPIPSDLCSKVNEAQKAVSPGYRIKAGDTLHVKLMERKPSGKGNPQNIFAVKLEPGQAAPPKSDPFATSAPAAQQSAFGDEPPF